MAISPSHRRWIGLGFKSGGQLLFGGVESVTAFMWNLGDGETFDLKIVSSRWGLGLGGSGGFVGVLGYGFTVPYELHGKSLNDWGVNIAFTEKWISKSTLQTIIHSKPLMMAYKGYKQNKIAMQTAHAAKAFDDAKFLETFRNMFHSVFAAVETVNKAGMVVLDLPGLGKGLEASAYVTRGTMYVSNPSQWIAPVGGDRI